MNAGQNQTGAARVISLLRSMAMPIAEVREIPAGALEAQDVIRLERTAFVAKKSGSGGIRHKFCL